MVRVILIVFSKQKTLGTFHCKLQPSSIQELQEGDQNDEIQLSPEEAFAAFAFAAACAGQKRPNGFFGI